MSIRVGSHQLGDSVLLAPMAGLTDYPFRKTMRALGAEISISEMTASRALLSEVRSECRKVSRLGERTVVQLAGCEPAAMAEAARICQDGGAFMIDLNFGCPAKKVVHRYAGSALMQDEVLTREILESVVKAVTIPVTLKMRTGWNEQNRNAPTVARIAEGCGISLITVHGRTRAQKFGGRADWRFVREVKRVVSIPVIANGDIRSESDARTCLEQSGADGLMIGRAAIGRPWFISALNRALRGEGDCSSPSYIEQFEIVRTLYSDMLDFYGPEHGVCIARKHLAAFLEPIPEGREVWGSIGRSSEPGFVLGKLEALYTDMAARSALAA